MWGRLVAVEGIDGSGKRTLVAAVSARLQAQGLVVGSLDFPRYDRNAFGALIRETLTTGAGDLYRSVYGMAALYAADRRESRDELAALLRTSDVVFCDRYVSSNAAYAGARLDDPDEREHLLRWLEHLELDLVALPRPALQVLLRTPPDEAARRASARAGADPDRALDSFEADHGYQARCLAVYEALVERSYLGPWTVVETVSDDGLAHTPDELSVLVADAVAGLNAAPA